ncbi:phosphoserine aminotransferase [Biscogniauxia marginata]|nr:phosphoserine aminotransferase [Biscogniauxia marginata]
MPGRPALLDFDNTGPAEHSHRSEHAADIVNQAKAHLATYLDIPDDYDVLQKAGEFSATVYNLAGAWVARKKTGVLEQSGVKSEEEASQEELILALKKAVDSELKPTVYWLGPEFVNLTTDSRTIRGWKFGMIPEDNAWKLSKDSALVYYCDNGADGSGPTVIADMFSNILSRRFPVKNSSVVFGAQKNLDSTGVTLVVIKKRLLPPACLEPSPGLMRKLGLPIAPVRFLYETVAKNDRLYSTLVIFEQCVTGQVSKKLLASYSDKALEAHPNTYKVVPDKSVLSRMNICFRVTANGETDKAETNFLKKSTAVSLTGLKGR